MHPWEEEGPFNALNGHGTGFNFPSAHGIMVRHGHRLPLDRVAAVDSVSSPAHLWACLRRKCRSKFKSYSSTRAESDYFGCTP